MWERRGNLPEAGGILDQSETWWHDFKLFLRQRAWAHWIHKHPEDEQTAIAATEPLMDWRTAFGVTE